MMPRRSCVQNLTYRIDWIDAVAMPAWGLFLAFHAAVGLFAFLPPSVAAAVSALALWALQESLGRIRTRSGHLEMVVTGLRVYRRLRFLAPRGRGATEPNGEE